MLEASSGEDMHTREEGFRLNANTRPTGSVTVIILVIVNCKDIDKKTQLLFYKEEAPEPDDRKRKQTEISNVSKMDKQHALMSAAGSAQSGNKARGPA